MASRKPTALVTGGAGFIGSHLCELLLDDGWEVFALDDLSTGGARATSSTCATRAEFHLVVDSVLSPSVVSELVHKCDVVYHLAAAVGVRLIVEQPVHTMVTNVQGTETVLDYCSRFGKRVLVASTSEVYGDHREERPLAEEDRRDLRPDHAEALAVRRLEGDGRVPRARLPPGARARLRDRAALQHRRPAPERPVRDGDPALRPQARSPASRSRSTATGRRRARSATCSDTIRALEGADGRALDLRRRSSTSARPSGSASSSSPTASARRPDPSRRRVFVPYDEVYGLGIEDTLHREPAIEKIGAAIGWRPSRTLDAGPRRRDRARALRARRSGSLAAQSAATL